MNDIKKEFISMTNFLAKQVGHSQATLEYVMDWFKYPDKRIRSRKRIIEMIDNCLKEINKNYIQTEVI